MSKSYKEKLSIVVATKDRPKDIEYLFKCLSEQTVKPFQIIIVDGGTEKIEHILRQYPGLGAVYTKKYPPSLTVQRNTGVRMVAQEATLIGFLDDDVVLETDAIEKMMDFWENSGADTGGAVFNITNLPKKYKANILEKIFFVGSDTPYSILSSGFQTKPVFAEKDMETKWLLGCAMVWRKEIFKNQMFDEWYKGLARCEEVDFCYEAGKRYKLYVVSKARLSHPPDRLEDPSYSFELGRMQMINRIYFVRKHKTLSLAGCYWGQIGLLGNNMIKAFLKRDKFYFRRAQGNICGLIAAVRNAFD